MHNSVIREVVDLIMAEAGNASCTPVFHTGKVLAPVPSCLYVGVFTACGNFPGVRVRTDEDTTVLYYVATGGASVSLPSGVLSLISASSDASGFTFVGYRIYAPSLTFSPAPVEPDYGSEV